jgi:hypothetical protein
MIDRRYFLLAEKNQARENPTHPKQGCHSQSSQP